MSKIHEEDWVDQLTAKYALKKDRPRQNTQFLLFLGVAGVALVIAMSIMAVQTQTDQKNCPCAVPSYTIPGTETKIPPTQEQCMTDQAYAECYTSSGSLYSTYAGCAGLGGALIVLCLLGLRFV